MLKSKDPGLLTLVKNGDGLQGPGTDFNPPHFLRRCLGGLEERQVTNAFYLGGYTAHRRLCRMIRSQGWSSGK
jgi:hypothetical protein